MTMNDEPYYPWPLARQSSLQRRARKLAEGVGFEPTVAFTTPVFKTGLFDHSSTPPGIMTGIYLGIKNMKLL